MANQRICSVEGCDKTHNAHGLCGMHQQRQKRWGDPLYTKNPPGGTIRDFFENRVLKHTGDECLFWPFTRSSAGYGQMWHEGKLHTVSRVVCEIENAPPPAGWHDAAHSCGNGHLGCVSRGHLSWKTRSGNIADMVRHGTARRGPNNPLATLNIDQVRQIRALRGKHSQAALGRMFNVHGETIGKIQRGDRWGWLK